MKTYLFYDLETSGLNQCFDQILQFAAIRTDENLNELERMEYFFRLRPDVLPDPRALLLNQISWENLSDGFLEYEGILKIFQAFNRPQTVTIGYNNLNFDDQFLRFAFYRNLLEPYQHQYANQCFRMDLFLMLIYYYLFLPKILQWPTENPLKLENLVIANNLSTSRTAHDALGDVEATIALAKVLKQSPKHWNYLENNFRKNIEEKNLKEKISRKLPVGWLLSGEFGYQNNFRKPAYYLGQHYHYSNQTLWLPLNHPIEKELPFNKTMLIRKKFGEGPFWLPLSAKYGPLSGVLIDNLNWLSNNPRWLQEVCSLYLNFKYPEIPNLPIEAALYQEGFWNDDERKNIYSFHAAPLTRKMQLLENSPPRIKELGWQLFYRNYPEQLPSEKQLERITYLNKIWLHNQERVDYHNQPYLTPQRWQEIFQNLTLPEQEHLIPLEQWIKKQYSFYI